MLAALLNVPHEPGELNYFSFNNADSHQQIINAIRVQKTVDLPVYILDPIPQEDIENWLFRHQVVHNQMNAVLAIQGADLSAVDWNDKDSLADWIQLHFTEHQQASTALGVA